MMRRVFVTTALLGCQGAPSRPDPAPAPESRSAEPTMKMPGPMPMKPAAPKTFAPGPPLTPASALLAWLQKEATAGGGRRTFRLPVVMRYEDEYRLAFDAVWIGLPPEPPTDGVHLRLDDTAMGVDVMTQLRDRCPPDQRTCAFWMEGYWGPLVDLPEPDLPEDGPKMWPFAVLKLAEPVDAAAKDARPGIDLP